MSLELGLIGTVELQVPHSGVQDTHWRKKKKEMLPKSEVGRVIPGMGINDTHSSFPNMSPATDQSAEIDISHPCGQRAHGPSRKKQKRKKGKKKSLTSKQNRAKIYFSSWVCTGSFIGHGPRIREAWLQPG